MAKLATTVHVHTGSGEFKVYGPEDDLPDEVAQKLVQGGWAVDRDDLWAEAPKKAPARAASADDKK